MVLQDGLEAEVRLFTILLLMSSILLGTLAKVKEKIVIPLSFRLCWTVIGLFNFQIGFDGISMSVVDFEIRTDQRSVFET